MKEANRDGSFQEVGRKGEGQPGRRGRESPEVGMLSTCVCRGGGGAGAGGGLEQTGQGTGCCRRSPEDDWHPGGDILAWARGSMRIRTMSHSWSVPQYQAAENE